jgi:predicted ATP-grasp superfamily ATP-dependent carboligase
MLTIVPTAPGGAVAPLPPEELYTLAPDLPDLAGTVLVEMLDGFVDAGAARRLTRDHLLAGGASVLVATFDVDLLFDYRARRPPMVFTADHWESYDAPRLDVRMLTDDVGTAYLLLSGPEPDVMWERFAAAVEGLVRRLGARMTVGTNAIPMAVPHTRPVGVTAHGSRPELVAEHPPWVGTVQVPGSASALLEHRLGRAGLDAIGFAVHVPHYLAQAAYPPAAEALLAAVTTAAGLRVAPGGLPEAAEEARTTIAALVEQSAELAELVRTLEEQYDAFLASRQGSLAEAAGLPSAEEIGAELERFLAEQTKKPDDPA